MAILIKGMEMPDSCFLCRFCRRQEYGEYVGEDTAWSCVASKKRITDGQDLIATFKHPDCPLVEVTDTQTEKKSPNVDMIFRREGIEALMKEFKRIPTVAIRAKTVIDLLPSVQPEIIRCKDCKWFGKAGCAIEIVDDSDKPTEDDFCSFAERREE